MIRWRWQPEEPPAHVDVQEHTRQRALREAEYQASLDAQSKILRISGGDAGAGAGRERRVIAGLVVRVTGDRL